MLSTLVLLGILVALIVVYTVVYTKSPYESECPYKEEMFKQGRSTGKFASGHCNMCDRCPYANECPYCNKVYDY